MLIGIGYVDGESKKGEGEEESLESPDALSLAPLSLSPLGVVDPRGLPLAGLC